MDYVTRTGGVDRARSKHPNIQQEGPSDFRPTSPDPMPLNPRLESFSCFTSPVCRVAGWTGAERRSYSFREREHCGRSEHYGLHTPRGAAVFVLGAIAYHNPHEIFDVLNVPTAVCNKQTVGDEDAEKQKPR